MYRKYPPGLLLLPPLPLLLLLVLLLLGSLYGDTRSAAATWRTSCAA
jgi:hypothetical protein